MVSALLIAGCGSSSTSGTNPSPSAAAVPTPPAASLVGAGSTFDQPVFNAAFFAYNQKFSQVQVNYQGVGSGAGISQYDKGTTDFGASDVPAKYKDLPTLGGATGTLQLPVVLGTVGLAYNIQGVANGQLKLTPTTICGIVTGKIGKWSDPAFKADNPSLSLPDAKITWVHRNEGSGTTYIVTDYLTHVCGADWTLGAAKQVTWPTTASGPTVVGAQGNPGVAAAIGTPGGNGGTPNSIGYVELAYIIQTNMTQATLKNHDGNFVLPSPAGATAAANAIPNPTPASFSIVDAPGKDSAPISGYSWVILAKQQKDATKGKALVDLLYWFDTSEGQTYATNLKYAPLPAAIQASNQDLLKTVTDSTGKVLLG